MGTITRLELKTKARRKLQEDGWNYWTEEAANEAADAAHKQVAFDTGALVRTLQKDVTANTREYAFDGQHIAPKQVLWEGEPLDIVEPEFLDTYDADWRATTGDDPSHATVENGALSLYPTPNATSSNKPLKLIEYHAPDEFADDNAAIEVPDYTVPALVRWMIAWLWEDYDQAKADAQFRKYEYQIRPYKRVLKYPGGSNVKRTSKQVDMKSYRDNY